MRTRLVVISALFAMSMPVMSAAQRLGSRLPGPSGSMVSSYGYPDDDQVGARPSDEAVKVARGMTKCIVPHKRADVAKFLLSKDEASRQATYARFSGLMPNCMGIASFGATELRISTSSLNGALAEAMLAAQMMPSLAAREPSKTATPYWLSDAADQRVVQEMAICLTDQFPQQSLALIRSVSGSSDEQTAFSALTPLMGPCLVSGASLHANRSGIRLALAGAMYHRINDPVDSMSTGNM